MEQHIIYSGETGDTESKLTIYLHIFQYQNLHILVQLFQFRL